MLVQSQGQCVNHDGKTDEELESLMRYKPEDTRVKSVIPRTIQDLFLLDDIIRIIRIC